MGDESGQGRVQKMVDRTKEHPVATWLVGHLWGIVIALISVAFLLGQMLESPEQRQERLNKAIMPIAEEVKYNRNILYDHIREEGHRDTMIKLEIFKELLTEVRNDVRTLLRNGRQPVGTSKTVPTTTPQQTGGGQ